MEETTIVPLTEFDFISYRHTKSRSDSLMNVFSHAHSGYEIIYLRQGSPVFGFEENTMPLKAGDILITPPQLYHFLQVPANDEYERIVFLLSPKALNLEVNLNKVLILSDEHKTLRRLIKDFAFYQENFEGEERREIFEIKTRELIFAINHLLPREDISLNSTANSTLKNILC